MIKIIIKHTAPPVLDQAANYLAQILKQRTNYTILGPEYPLISRVNKFYIKEIWIKAERGKIQPNLKQTISESITATHNHRGYSNVMIQIDVDTV